MGRRARATARATVLCGVACALALAPLLAASAALASLYVRDEIRINLRAGPGEDFRILKLLRSGDALVKLGDDGEWAQVRLDSGEEGWVPERFLTEEIPARILLPEIQEKYGLAQSELEALREQLGANVDDLTEVAELRERNSFLQAENDRLSGRASAMQLGIGAGIALVCVLIGALFPRGGGAANRRIRL